MSEKEVLKWVNKILLYLKRIILLFEAIFFLNNLFCCDCASKLNCKNTLLGPPLANSILMYEHVGKYI